MVFSVSRVETELVLRAGIKMSATLVMEQFSELTSITSTEGSTLASSLFSLVDGFDDTYSNGLSHVMDGETMRAGYSL